jgi:hypothetical protein
MPMVSGIMAFFHFVFVHGLGLPRLKGCGSRNEAGEVAPHTSSSTVTWDTFEFSALLFGLLTNSARYWLSLSDDALKWDVGVGGNPDQTK